MSDRNVFSIILDISGQEQFRFNSFQMTRTHYIQPKMDFIFIYKDYSYPILINVFKAISKFAETKLLPYINNFSQNKTNNETPSFNIDSIIQENVKISSLSQFFEACHFKEIQLTEENFSDFLYLTNLFEIEIFDECLQQYSKDHPKEGILKKLIQIYQNESNNEIIYDNSIFPEEIFISEHLDQFIEDDKIFKLPFQAIYRITERFSIERSKKEAIITEIRIQHPSKENDSRNDNNENDNEDEQNENLIFLTDSFQSFLLKCFKNYQSYATLLVNLFKYHSIDDIIPFVLEPSFSFSYISNPNLSKKIKAYIQDCYSEKLQIPKELNFQHNDNILFFKDNLSKDMITDKELTTIKIKEGITVVKSHFIENWMSLKVIEISSTVQIIEEEAFYNCPNIEHIIFNSEETKYQVSSFFPSTGIANFDIFQTIRIRNGDTFIYIPYQIYQKYDMYSVNFLSRDTKIKDIRFQHQTVKLYLPNLYDLKNNFKLNNFHNLQIIYFTDSIKTIPNQLLSCLRFLREIHLPDSITSIGCCAFYNCSSLVSIILPNSITSIGKYAFRSCSSLVNIKFPNSLTSIGSHAFRSCSSLVSINLPNSITSIGSHAFDSCSSLVSINLPNSLKYFDPSIFTSCKSLKILRLPNSIHWLKKDRLAYSHIEKLIFQNSPETIPKQAFYSLTDLKEIFFPDSLTTIDEEAFCNCISLEKLYFPASLTTICKGAFSGCSQLKEVYFPNTLKTIEAQAFSHCHSLDTVHIPASCKIEPTAFEPEIQIKEVNI
ncbi:hypothetical protein TRFO_35868 [Tritrichomonas foetus]|uniref:Surface antigen BspA-like n=1 Tax=Tritrichomonas foetus TaxID=1144522 RepID=A0A1J4JGR3_9EUKA|nr:hypothetical protein TRFO_35868 [Tritrichomonas foetus]|eukprot:OHS97857.1 hypothetical protein TRFO_35868 [Tritrichomonas foetus]